MRTRDADILSPLTLDDSTAPDRELRASPYDERWAAPGVLSSSTPAGDFRPSATSVVLRVCFEYHVESSKEFPRTSVALSWQTTPSGMPSWTARIMRQNIAEQCIARQRLPALPERHSPTLLERRDSRKQQRR